MSTVGEMMTRYRRFRERARERRRFVATCQAVSQLPQHIQKDIGWPAAYDRQAGRSA